MLTFNFLATVAIVFIPTHLAASNDSARPKDQFGNAATPASGEFQVTEVKRADGFGEWIESFEGRARAHGISVGVLEEALKGISYDIDVVNKDRNQSEFTKQIWDYLDSAVSDARVTNGKNALAEYDVLLRKIEKKYGVEKEIVAAIWGLESAFGSMRGNIPTIQALASLSYDGRRSEFFEGQLIAALKILQSGDVSAENMTGSWAGAMGHTQFMPTSFLEYAVDFTGSGKRDIWRDDPTDALASTAAYLHGFGWTTGQPWGVEIALPKGFDYALTGKRIKKPGNAWANLGVRGRHGKIVPNYGLSSILVPAGAEGAAFMIFNNFHILEKYNAADAYVLGVGHLADRMAGGAAIQAEWPRGDMPIGTGHKIQMQKLLTEAGFDTFGTDGIIGPNTISAIRAFQESVGMVPDGYASARILTVLKN